MSKTSIRASAPGSLMLMGEHAVLHGHPSLVCAVNRRMVVTLSSRSDSLLHIQSALGEYTAPLEAPAPDPRFRFVLAALARQKEVQGGLDLVIESEFSHTVGLGSSAAVTVALQAALDLFLGKPLDARRVFEASRSVIREVQGLGSGADVAASVYGGIVAYRADPLEIESLLASHPVTVIYSGSKMPTAEVVRKVQQQREQRPELFDGIFSLMGQSVPHAVEAIRVGDWASFGALLNLNQGLMDALGVSNARLSEIVHALRSDPNILGAKISGSGLGDCAIGLGASARKDWPYEVLPVSITNRGLLQDEPG